MRRFPCTAKPKITRQAFLIWMENGTRGTHLVRVGANTRVRDAVKRFIMRGLCYVNEGVRG